jgi:hypothetical protein
MHTPGCPRNHNLHADCACDAIAQREHTSALNRYADSAPEQIEQLTRRNHELELLVSALGELAKDKDTDRVFFRDKCVKLQGLLQQMLDVAENADETGYVTDVGFVDLEKLHAEVRAALA